MLEAIEDAQAELLRRIASQDREALGEFYDQVAAPLYTIACRILANPADAEEVIQDVFVIIWNKAANYDSTKGKAFHWATSLTRHRCIDRLRSRQRRAKIIVAFASDAEWSQVIEVQPENSPFEKQDLNLIRSAVNNLPTDQRQAIELAFFSGHSHQQISELLNEPLGTIKARIRRGMLKLKESLKDYL